MQSALKLTTRVLPGKRIEICDPELIEGEEVELIVSAIKSGHEKEQPAQETPKSASAWDYLQSFPPVHHTPEEWKIIEREMQEEKDAWGD